MFILVTIADSIRVPPQLLAQPTLTSVASEIERRYPNRVVPDAGLIVCPWGPPLEVGDGVLVPGDGGAHHQVVFRAVAFRPFVGEVLMGTVLGSDANGLSVSVGGFFDHVFVPAYWMLNPSEYDQEAGLWVWTPKYDDDDEEEEGETGEEEGEKEESRFEIEIGAEVRFKVKSVTFTKVTSTMKGVQATTTNAAGGGKLQKPMANGSSAKPENGKRSPSDEAADDEPPPPMRIVGSICEDGLGVVEWWGGGDEEEDEEGEEEEEEEEGEEGYDDWQEMEAR